MQACADPTFGLPVQILNLVRFLGTVEPDFADWDGSKYLIVVETVIHEGVQVLIRIHHPDWKHRCLNFLLGEEYGTQKLLVAVWEAPHPDEGRTDASHLKKTRETVADYGDFGSVLNVMWREGMAYYRQVREDEAEAQKMVKDATDKPDLEVLPGGSA